MKRGCEMHGGGIGRDLHGLRGIGIGADWDWHRVLELVNEHKRRYYIRGRQHASNSMI